MSYSIIIWDNDRAKHKVWFPKTLSVVGEAIDHLAKETPGPNVRFERLAQHLLKHFPLPPKEPGPNASQDERDAYHDAEESVWCNDPVQEVRELQGALWQPDILNALAPQFLSVLLPMARVLHLDVLDDTVGIYYPANRNYGTVVPAERADVLYALDPSAATPVKYTKATVRKYLTERMAAALAPHGFTPVKPSAFGFHFERKIEGGRQELYDSVEGSEPDYRTGIRLKSRSDRMQAIATKAYAGLIEAHEPTDFRSASFTTTLSELRREMYPAWRNAGADQKEYIRNTEEMDWMVEDLLRLGLPVLDKTRTIEGLNWLYTGEEGDPMCFMSVWNLSANEGIRRRYAAEKLVYARLAGNPRFEEMVDYLSQPLDNTMAKNSPESFRQIVDYCRNVLQPLGTGPA
jgi:hypothetical protein